MALEVGRYNTVQGGLREFVNLAYSMSQNMQTRAGTPILPDNTNIWATRLDSKTIQLYGGVNEDNRQRFKIDHSFDLSALVNAIISSDGSIAQDQTTYDNSQGTEFIVLQQSEVMGADANYAIRTDKYQAIKEQLSQGKLNLKGLKQSGGFKLNSQQTSEDVLESDGWLELAAGKNKATAQEYAAAKDSLKSYVSEAKSRNCFPDGKGMGFFIEIGAKDYKARPWCIGSSCGRSSAGYRGFFGYRGRFLRVRQEIAA